MELKKLLMPIIKNLSERTIPLKFEDLKRFEPGLELIYPEGQENLLEIYGLTDFRAFEEGRAIFVQNDKYFESAKENVDKLEERKVGIIFSQAIWQKFQGSEELEKIEKNVRFLAKVENVGLAMSRLSYPYYLEEMKHWNDEVDGRQLGTVDIHPSAYIAQNVFIGKEVVIGPNTRIHSGAVISSCVDIGACCEIFSNVSLYPKVKIGNDVRIHAGSVIGADGFGYNFDQNEHLKVWHVGGVVIQDNVEIGPNSCIDQGTFSPTCIGEGSKLDGQVLIGHNCQIGKKVLLCGQVAISGSTSIGDFTIFAGKSAAGDNITIGRECLISGGAMVNKSCSDASRLGGHPARPQQEWLKGIAYLRKMSLNQTKKNNSKTH